MTLAVILNIAVFVGLVAFIAYDVTHPVPGMDWWGRPVKDSDADPR